MLYILLASMTPEGQQRLHDNPDMLNEICNQIDVPDTKLLARYAVLGRYDFVLMAEARDVQAVARLSLDLGARGRLHIETLPAIALGLLTEPPDGQGGTSKTGAALETPSEAVMDWSFGTKAN